MKQHEQKGVAMTTFIDRVQPLINELARRNSGLQSPTLRLYNARTGEEFRIEQLYEDDGIVCVDIVPTGEITQRQRCRDCGTYIPNDAEIEFCPACIVANNCTCEMYDDGDGESGPHLQVSYDEACPVHGHGAQPDRWIDNGPWSDVDLTPIDGGSKGGAA
jgi:hypothetical protein